MPPFCFVLIIPCSILAYGFGNSPNLARSLKRTPSVPPNRATPETSETLRTPLPFSLHASKRVNPGNTRNNHHILLVVHRHTQSCLRHAKPIAPAPQAALFTFPNKSRKTHFIIFRQKNKTSPRLSIFLLSTTCSLPFTGHFKNGHKKRDDT